MRCVYICNATFNEVNIYKIHMDKCVYVYKEHSNVVWTWNAKELICSHL